MTGVVEDYCRTCGIYLPPKKLVKVEHYDRSERTVEEVYLCRPCSDREWFYLTNPDYDPRDP